MGLPWSVLKYILLCGLVAALLYARMILSRRRLRQSHGRDRWRAAFRQRRRDRLAAAETWEERRRIQQETQGARRIRFRIEPGGDAGEPGGAGDGSGDKPAEPDGSAPGCEPEGRAWQ